jgi:chorismate mutase
MPYQPPKGFIRMNLNVQEDLHTAFKVAVTSERKNMTDVLIELMQRYVAEHGPSAPRKKTKR